MILKTERMVLDGKRDDPPNNDLLDTVQKPVKIEVHSLDILYGKAQVLYNVTMTIPEATITAIVGPSGSGKSTFLRSLNRLHDLTATVHIGGNILLDGEDIMLYERNGVQVSRLRQRVGMIFQQPNPFPQSIFDNVAYGLRLRRTTSQSTLREQVEQALRRVELWEEVKDQLKHSALHLACGQQQRLCLARLVATLPEVLLLDEPHATLDPAAARAFEHLILQLGQQYTIVIATCNPKVAHQLASNMCSLTDGHLLQCSLKQQAFISPR